MGILTGSGLLLLTLYFSTIGFVLRRYLRSRLAASLPPQQQQHWLDWVGRHESELQILASLCRLGCILGLLISVLSVLGTVVGPGWATYVAAWGCTLVLVAIFGVGVPYALAEHAGEAILARSVRALALLLTLLWVVVRALLAIESLMTLLLGGGRATREEQSERVEQEILQAVEEGEAVGAVDEEQKEMIESALTLDETPVSAIMTPRTDIVAVPAEAGFDEVRNTILRTGHSRIPVYEESVDHIIGVVYAKDLLRVGRPEEFQARRMMRVAPFVPETKTVNDLLSELRASRVQIAIVVDEYGTTSGLVTIEDILEELVGEIADEYEPPEPAPIQRVDSRTFDVDARTPISQVNDELNLALPEEAPYGTIGGFVFATLGRIPTAGEKFTWQNLHISVLEAEPRRIRRLRIEVTQPAEASV